jgi:hypothetical protein
MPQARPAGPAGDHGGEAASRPTRHTAPDQHGRRQPTPPATNATGPRRTTGPSWTIGPPKTAPMSAEQHQRAVQAWAALIAAWWAKHPPDPHHQEPEP